MNAFLNGVQGVFTGYTKIVFFGGFISGAIATCLVYWAVSFIASLFKRVFLQAN